MKPHFLHDVFSDYGFPLQSSEPAAAAFSGRFHRSGSHYTKDTARWWTRGFQKALGGWEAGPEVVSGRLCGSGTGNRVPRDGHWRERLGRGSGLDTGPDSGAS